MRWWLVGVLIFLFVLFASVVGVDHGKLKHGNLGVDPVVGPGPADGGRPVREP
jgi:hypothetical protein